MLEFIFRSGWTFVGTVFLLLVIGEALTGIVTINKFYNKGGE